MRKRDYLFSKSQRYGSNNSRPYILPESRVINIDNKTDFVTAEAMMKTKKYARKKI